MRDYPEADSQSPGSQTSNEDPIDIVFSSSEPSHLIHNNELQCNDLSNSEAPVTSADKAPVNCQTITVEVHHESSQVDNVNGDNGINTGTHENFD